jgi:hypothetical protein
MRFQGRPHPHSTPAAAGGPKQSPGNGVFLRPRYCKIKSNKWQNILARLITNFGATGRNFCLRILIAWCFEVLRSDQQAKDTIPGENTGAQSMQYHVAPL